ncbi:MAG: twin-arginine translocase subunit TatC [Candidatus Melainabacteria bacterium]|nr:twin-arginine translocase subunit TatC [Candidatus Melainabacteria bacterium]
MKPISTKELDLYNKKNGSEPDVSPLMPLSAHLTELRNKVIISLIVLCITTLIGFSTSREIIKLLTNIAPIDTAFLQIKPGEFFFTSLRVALFFGLGIASPIIIWQLASFIVPGLSSKEKKVAVPILAGAPVLFCIGSVFAYYFVAPSMLNFLFGFGKDVISTSISIENFVSFTLMIMAICGCTFLLPIIIFTLANAGIVNSKMLINKWRYALLASVISGAVLTPTPDPFNMSIVSGILIALYFISWGILKMVQK